MARGSRGRLTICEAARFSRSSFDNVTAPYPHIECDRTPARGIQAADQDANRPAERGNRRPVVLGIVGFGTDHNAKSRRLAKPRRKPSDQIIDLAA
jgi:hypothetical protein